MALKISSTSSSTPASSLTRNAASSPSADVFSIGLAGASGAFASSSSSNGSSAGSSPVRNGAGGKLGEASDNNTGDARKASSSTDNSSGPNGQSSATTAAGSTSSSDGSSAASTNQAAAQADTGSQTNTAAQASATPGEPLAGNEAQSLLRARSAVPKGAPNPAARARAASSAPGAQATATSAATSQASSPASLSILQLLAQSLDGEVRTTPSDTTGSPDCAALADNSKAAADPNAAVLALVAQAALVGNPFAASQAAAATQTAANTSAAPSDDAAAAIAGGVKGSASSQDLLALLAKELDADSPGSLDSSSAQGDGAGAKGATAGDSTIGSNSLAPGSTPLANLEAAAHLLAPQHAASDPRTLTSELRAPVGSAAWNDELGGQLTLMTARGIESGSLKLSPEHLGPVEVTISVQNGDASVWFGASQPDTRAALEQALPRLREMFANQGLALTDSGVSRESPRNPSKPAAPQAIAAVSPVGDAQTSTPVAARISLGLVDTYA